MEGVSWGQGWEVRKKRQDTCSAAQAGPASCIVLQGDNQAIMSQTLLKALSWDALPSLGPAPHPYQTRVQAVKHRSLPNHCTSEVNL